MADHVLGLINPGMAMFFAVAAFFLWRRDPGKRYLLGFVVAPVAIGIAMTVNHYAPDPESMASRLTVQISSIIASISVVWAACTRLARPVPLKTWIAAGAMVGVLNAIAVHVGSFTASYFLVNSVCGIVFVMGGQLLAQAGSRDLVDRVMVWLFAIVALQFFVRPAAVVIVEGTMDAEQYRDSVGYAVLTVTAAILTLMLASSVLATILSDQIRDMQTRSQSDPLTGLPLRRGFEERVDRKLAESEETNVPVSLIIADIDHFKQVNDLWGHQAGDRAIESFGRLIARNVRRTDIAGRIGGEEFCVLVWNCDHEEARGLAERLRKTFAAMPHDGINDDVRLTASFGVTTVRRREGYVRAFSRADQALYEAKQAGRDRVVLAAGTQGRWADPEYLPRNLHPEDVASAA